MTTPNASALVQKPWGMPAEKTPSELLQEWLNAKNAMDAAKNLEMELRKQVVAAFPFPAGAKEGTHRIDLNAGYQLKVVLKQNYNLDNKNGATDKALAAWEEAGKTDVEKALRSAIADRLVKWKPELSITEYRLLDAAALAALQPVLTITDGSPALELVEPKTGK